MSSVRPLPSPVLPHIEELLLQRAEMLLIDRVVAFAPDRVEVVAHLAPEHPLADERGIPCWIGVELMAQAVATFSGLELHRLGQPPRIGLLLGTRSYTAHAPYFSTGVELTVSAQLLWRDTDGLGVFDCVLRDGVRELARAQLKGFAPDDIEAHLEAAIDG